MKNKKKWVLTVMVMAALAVLSGCRQPAAEVEEAPPVETILITGEQLYLLEARDQSASLPGSYTVKLKSTNANWGIEDTGIPVGTVVDGKLSLELQPLETSQLSPLFAGLPTGATVDPPNPNVILVQHFQIYTDGGIASGTFLYENEPRTGVYFLYSDVPLTVSASTPELDFGFQAAPGWNWLWGDGDTITNDAPDPLDAKWLYTAP